MPSALEEYSRDYGARLRAALNGGSISALDQPTQRQPAPRDPAGAGPYIPPEDPNVPMDPGGTADPEGGQDMGGPASSALAAPAQQPDQQPDSAMQKQGDGYSFRQMWKDAPESAKKAQVDKLEESLKRGNQTIDDAYDELERQLGTPPAKKKSLSKQEKGMLLMEFGLNVLANNKKGLGAIGEAGGKSLQSYNDMTQGPYKDYQRTKSAIEASRAGAKVKLAEQSALEGVKVRSDMVNKLPGKFTDENGYVWFYDEMGKAVKALDEKGNPIKASLAERNGPGEKEFESDSKYKRYMEIYGVDHNGQPLTGLALERVKRDALDFANDRGRQQSDLDLDILSEQSADKEMGADAYRDLTPDQREEQRNKIVKARRDRLRRPVRSYLETPEPARGNPSGMKKRFASMEDAKAAYRRGEIQQGDTIIVNGVEGPVE